MNRKIGWNTGVGLVLAGLAVAALSGVSAMAALDVSKIATKVSGEDKDFGRVVTETQCLYFARETDLPKGQKVIQVGLNGATGMSGNFTVFLPTDIHLTEGTTGRDSRGENYSYSNGVLTVTRTRSDADDMGPLFATTTVHTMKIWVTPGLDNVTRAELHVLEEHGILARTFGVGSEVVKMTCEFGTSPDAGTGASAVSVTDSGL